jgi:hypothetical protein
MSAVQQFEQYAVWKGQVWFVTGTATHTADDGREFYRWEAMAHCKGCNRQFETMVRPTDDRLAPKARRYCFECHPHRPRKPKMED